MTKTNWAALLAVAILIIVGFVLVRLVYFGGGMSTYNPPHREIVPANLDIAAASARNTAVDKAPATGKGITLVDFGHDNALYIEELNSLYTQLVSRGFEFELIPPEAEEGQTLVDRLKYAKSLILPLSRAQYTAAEVTALTGFVKNGGRILIIGDPTRTVAVDSLNSAAGAFGIIFANDYLYNLSPTGMDNNYRNVVYHKFADSPLTAGLSEKNKVIFYSGSSINAPGHEIILGDDATHSSTSEGGRTLAAAALTTNNQVLAVGDLTFFSEPYSAAESNGTFINNIADFLTGSDRRYALRDFPYFFRNTIDIVFNDPKVFNSQLGNVEKLKETLVAKNYKVDFADKIGTKNDVIFVGRFTEASVVKDYLADGGIVILDPPLKKDDVATPTPTPEADISADATPQTVDQEFVDGRIQIAGVGELERGGSTLLYWHRAGDQNILIILSDNPDTNTDAFNQLLDNKLNECEISATVAVCQTQNPVTKLPPSLRKTRIDKILVVADDSGRARADQQTGGVEFENILSDTYKVTLWTTSSEGSPDLAELQQYDAVIWTSGDYWDDSISEQSAATLTKYIEAGGNLILSGASVAFDWDHTDFLKNVVHADYLTSAEQVDLEPTMPDHPLAKGFTAGQTIELLPTPSGTPLEIDVLSHTPDARVIFQRGPNSNHTGAASVIAFEDSRAKVAFIALPIYLLPDKERTLLVKNSVDWFTRKPLDLPDVADYNPYKLDGNDTTGTGDQATPEPTPADNGTNGDTGTGDQTNQNQ